MKKLRIFLVMLISMLLFYSNEVCATTQGTYVPTQSSWLEKVILIGIGAGSVLLVLFIGYKLDRREENDKRRETFFKKYKDKEKICDTTNNSVETPNLTEKKPENQFEEEVEPEVSEEEISLEDIIDNDLINELIEPEEKYVDIEKKEIDDTSKNIEKMISVFENADSTMVFNSQELKGKNNIRKTVKGYDYEDDEDEDLLELENTIKEANFKRYTRKKTAGKTLIEETEKKEETKPSKRYTRKKKKEQPKNHLKRYTRKKPVAQNIVEEQNEEVAEEEAPVVVKPKRGRPRKADQPVKRGRGRPRKPENIVKPKRGRPRKKDSAKTTKKSTTKK